MSAAARRSFAAELRRIDADLPVPLPERVRFLRELEHDLEALHSDLLAQGVGADQARRRALDALLPDRGTLDRLERVHMPAYRRLTRGLGEGRLRLIERFALVLATASVLGVQAGLLVRADLLTDPSPFLVPVLALGGLLFALCAWKVFEVWIKRDHRAPERGLDAIAGLCLAVLGVALIGLPVDTYHLAATLEASAAPATPLATRWLVRECVLLAVAILFALAGGLVWFVIRQWEAAVIGARREILEPSFNQWETSSWP